MAVKLLLETMLVLLFLNEASAQYWPVAKPGCQEKCGDVVISYPFGIGEKCAFDDGFEIYCNNSFNPPKPFLRNNKYHASINLEVLGISLPYEAATIRLNYPITKDCTNTSDDVPDIRFPGRFTFSDTENRFIAMGCNNLALLRSGSLEYEFTAAGCVSMCNTSSLRKDNTCFGINCCQTSFQPDLDNIRPSLSSSHSGQASTRCSDGARYGFIVDQKWFEDLPDIYSVQTMETVPVVLNIDFACSNEKYKCGINAFCNGEYEYLIGNSYAFCSCQEGYEGNPYLPNGCQDINECENGGGGCDHICTNTPGSHNCSCYYGWVRDGEYYCVEMDDSVKKEVDHRVKKAAIIVITGTCAGLGVLLAATWWLYKVIRRRMIRKLEEKFFKRNGGLLFHKQVSSNEGNMETTKLFTSKELEKATDRYNADRIVGQGGQGTVYKGMLTDGRIVAVKKSKIEDESKLEHFINEVVILSQINHRNVVKLHGCCLQTEVPLLVYEFIPNGTLM